VDGQQCPNMSKETTSRTKGAFQDYADMNVNS